MLFRSGEYPVIPIVAEGAMAHSKPYVASAQIQSGIGFPGELTEGWEGRAIAKMGELLGKPSLWLFAGFLFLYVACEIGVWNWLAQLLQSRGVDAKAAQNIVGSGFAFGILVGRVVVSRILIKVPASMVLLASAADRKSTRLNSSH